ncbi:MAG TPA: hypothetical protein VHM92_05455 [Allosphingosinicella sp.]|nr:hypothetical protein [Allosphingosinicella sp.]
MRFAPLAALALLATACGGDDTITARANSAEELENRLDRLSQGKTEEEKPRLSYLQVGDLTPELRATPSCRLHQQGKLVLVVNARGAVARIDGRRVALALSAPVGPTGGFLTAPRVTISVGRTAPFAPGADVYASGWTATATLAGDPEREIEKIEGTWICSR